MRSVGLAVSGVFSAVFVTLLFHLGLIVVFEARTAYDLTPYLTLYAFIFSLICALGLGLPVNALLTRANAFAPGRFVVFIAACGFLIVLSLLKLWSLHSSGRIPFFWHLSPIGAVLGALLARGMIDIYRELNLERLFASRTLE